MLRRNEGLIVLEDTASAGEGGAAAAQPEPADQGTMLADAAKAGAEAAPAAAGPLSGIPEKYRVNGADGKLDVSATLAKVDAARGHLEQRLGAGGLPPEKADGYKTDSVYAQVKQANGGNDFALPEDFLKGVNELAHSMKLTQDQYDTLLRDGVLGMISGLVDQSFEHAMKTGRAELEKAWGPNGVKPDSPQMKAAFKAFGALPENMRTQENMDSIGNHPLVLQILSHFGNQIREDSPPKDAGGQDQGVARLDAILSDKAYWNAKDPRHDALVQEAHTLFAKNLRPTSTKGRVGRVVL